MDHCIRVGSIEYWADNIIIDGVEETGLPIVPLEDCIGNVTTYLRNSSFLENIRIYGAELVYLKVIEIDVNEHWNRDNIILYPFWAVYFQRGMNSFGATGRAIVLDAVTGECVG